MTVSAGEVKKLRDITGAGMMDCKSALTETNGDIGKAVEYLRKKGIASAQKREGREVKEGTIITYVHPGSRLGVMVEVNCETDFVAKTDDFQLFSKDIAMQIAATNPLAIQREDLSPEYIEQERDIFKKLEKESGKPDKIIDKIVEGKLEKLCREVCLLEQPYYKDDTKTVEQMVKEAIAKLGENIEVKRIFRMQVGEG